MQGSGGFVAHYLIGLGANVPTGGSAPVDTLDWALGALSQQGVALDAVSAFYATPAFPAGSGPDFANAAARVSSPLPPETFLDLLHEIEEKAGRERIKRWGPRVLDLDLLAAGSAIIPNAQQLSKWMALSTEQASTVTPDTLLLPHPRLHERGFVLVPLADVAPDWCHPLTGRTIAEMRDALPAEERGQIRPIPRKT
jgi:2-amino-4-hydroxy-6-hydroxymethyldihydropteridine diphosphokinase